MSFACSSATRRQRRALSRVRRCAFVASCISDPSVAASELRRIIVNERRTLRFHQHPGNSWLTNAPYKGVCYARSAWLNVLITFNIIHEWRQKLKDGAAEALTLRGIVARINAQTITLLLSALPKRNLKLSRAVPSKTACRTTPPRNDCCSTMRRTGRRTAETLCVTKLTQRVFHPRQTFRGTLRPLDPVPLR